MAQIIIGKKSSVREHPFKDEVHDMADFISEHPQTLVAVTTINFNTNIFARYSFSTHWNVLIYIYSYIKDDVLASVNSFVADHKQELESLGITRGTDGRLVIDSDKLAAAVNDKLSSIKETFGGFDGLAVQVINYATRISTDSPLNYAKEAEGLSTDYVDYLYGTSATILESILQGMLLNTFA